MSLLRRRQRGAQGNLLSFLDVISSGFGAIVLLLVITKTAEPVREIEARAKLRTQAEQLALETPKVEQRIAELEAGLADSNSELQALQKRLQAMPTPAIEQANVPGLDKPALSAMNARLSEARQSLTEEMRRLLADRKRTDNTVGGIPVDSEYIIFVIDTSGSMQRAWSMVIRKLTETLDIYPQVRGLQIMSDMGDYMFEKTEGMWIPDTPNRRQAIIRRMGNWQPLSNSSPVEGIQRAITQFARPGQRMSIYVFGDEFSGKSIQPVINRVRRLNPKDEHGQTKVRIHAIGFPTQFLNRGISVTGTRFALLMRELTSENSGTFVGLGQDQGIRHPLL